MSSSLRLGAHPKSRSGDVIGVTPNGKASFSEGVLQCWDMKAMKVEVGYNRSNVRN